MFHTPLERERFELERVTNFYGNFDVKKSIRFRIAQAWERRWKRVVEEDSDQRSRTKNGFFKAALSLATPLYWVGTILHRQIYQKRFVSPTRLEIPIVCVGNLSLGGTGKTPVVEGLAKNLLQRGARVAVVSRGYGGEIETAKTISAVVVSDGKTLFWDAARVGDEPVELAIALPGVPVVVGPRRAQAARLAMNRFQLDIILLDDGFQHHALERACDIVVIDATRLPTRQRLFPRGTLRERLGALSRANAVILTRTDQVEVACQKDLEIFEKQLRRRYPHLIVARTALHIRGLTTLEKDKITPREKLRGKKAFLFCGVGNPRSVEVSLRAIGLDVVAQETLPDHGAADTRTMRALRNKTQEVGASFLVCTRKDAVKIPEDARHHPTLPLWIPDTEWIFLNEDNEKHFMDHVFAQCRRFRKKN